jgi:hypothetical protein
VSAPYSAPPAPASGTARGPPHSHADSSVARRAPPVDEANGSLRPAHTRPPTGSCRVSGLLGHASFGGRGWALALG